MLRGRAGESCGVRQGERRFLGAQALRLRVARADAGGRDHGVVPGYGDRHMALSVIRAVWRMSRILEGKRKKQYYYDTVNVKRLILGSGGKSGNCEYCEEAADRGWIDQDDVFEGPMGDEDEPPLHPNCDCTVEYAEKRRRVYV